MTTAEEQRIAEGIFGPLEWNGSHAWCKCPGEGFHSKPSTDRDLHVVVEPQADGLKPGVYCWHQSCGSVVESLCFQLRSALGKRSVVVGARVALPVRPRAEKPVFDPVKLAEVAAKVPPVREEALAAVSSKRVENRTPASFLSELYRPGEKVVVFDVFESHGQKLFEVKAPPFDAGALDSFRKRKRCGVWFQNQPVSGEYLDTGRKEKDGSPKMSRRFEGVCTRFPYLLLESDHADHAHWLAMLVQLPLPIVSITSSGGKSLHALVRIGAATAGEFRERVEPLKAPLIKLGADRPCFSAVRLTRLPLCERLGNEVPVRDAQGKPVVDAETGRAVTEYVKYPEPRLQRLLYLNPDADETPICERGSR